MPTASEIIERVKARYAGCRSYEDTGEVTRVIVTQPEPWIRQTESVSFKTAFVRPTYFHFESAQVASGPKSEWARGAAWKNESGVFQWSTFPIPQLADEPLTLDLALAGMCGLAALKVIQLLGCLARSHTPLVDGLATVTRAEWANRDCFVLEGEWRGQPRQVWVESATFLVCRADSRTEFDAHVRAEDTARVRAELAKPKLSEKQREVLEWALAQDATDEVPDFTTETTTVWHPRIDHDIDPKVFEFTPPG